MEYLDYDNGNSDGYYYWVMDGTEYGKDYDMEQLYRILKIRPLPHTEQEIICANKQVSTILSRIRRMAEDRLSPDRFVCWVPGVWRKLNIGNGLCEYYMKKEIEKYFRKKETDSRRNNGLSNTEGCSLGNRRALDQIELLCETMSSVMITQIRNNRQLSNFRDLLPEEDEDEDEEE
jgi:hypothetical protein